MQYKGFKTTDTIRQFHFNIIMKDDMGIYVNMHTMLGPGIDQTV